MSTNKIQHRDQGFKKSFYYIRLYAQMGLKGDATQTPCEVWVHLKKVLPSDLLVIVETTTRKLRLQRKRKRLWNEYTYSYLPNILVLMIICLQENTSVDSKLSYLFSSVPFRDTGNAPSSVRFLYQILWLQMFY